MPGRRALGVAQAIRLASGTARPLQLVEEAPIGRAGYHASGKPTLNFEPLGLAGRCAGHRTSRWVTFRIPCSNDDMTIAVVIPFFQETEGLLARAIRSVVAQQETGDLRIVVVDDSSPVAAAAEIAALGIEADRVRIDIVRQANAGPAAARNRGLDSVRGCARVAFLDSDDVWSDRHLANATRALDAGHDFYFADLLQPGQTISGFERAGRLANGAHRPIADSETLFAYGGDMFDQIVCGNVIGTSTVVYAFDRFPEQRFDEAFYSAGEDYLFWIALARGGARFCFSSEVEASYGYGVNVYAGSGWGTPGYLRRIHNEMRYRVRLLDFDLSDRQRRFVREKIEVLRVEFASDILHRLTHRRSIPRDIVQAQFRLDPFTLLSLPLHLGTMVADRIKGRRA